MNSTVPGDVPRDGEEPLVSYFDSGQLVIQTFRGELVIAGETVRIER